MEKERFQELIKLEKSVKDIINYSNFTFYQFISDNIEYNYCPICGTRRKK